MKSQKLYKLAKTKIPGGTQLLSKRPEMFAPGLWPGYFKKAKGVYVWDLDNKKYTDMSIMSVGACILGYSDKDVDNAVIKSIKKGVASSLNSYEEFELAELLTKLHPWANMVRYARGGGEAMSIAVRIARAYKKRDLIFFSGYHGWNDWYLSANLRKKKSLDKYLLPGLKPLGIPKGLDGTAIPFEHGNIENLKKVIAGREKEIAAIVIEPVRGEESSKSYLKQLKSFSSDIGAVLIFDEITSGFRMNIGGIHLLYGVNPDIAVFAKSMANGYAMSAVIGIEKIMQMAQSTFISSTNWTERVGPSAALATIKKIKKQNVFKHNIKIGNLVKKVWQRAASKYNIDIEISGISTLANFKFLSKHNQIMQTFFCAEMLKHNFLGFRQFRPSFAHSISDINRYEKVVNLVFEKISKKNSNQLLTTPIAHSGFFRLTKE